MESSKQHHCNNHRRQRQTLLALSLSLLGGSSAGFQSPSSTFSPIRSRTSRTRSFSTLDKEDVDTTAVVKPSKTMVDPSNLSAASRINSQTSEPTVLDLSSYENALLSAGDEDVSLQRGFDWEIEKLRRHFAGLRQREEDGVWVCTPSLFDFLVTHTPSMIVGVDASGRIKYEIPPKPVNALDVAVLIVKNLLNTLGFGPSMPWRRYWSRSWGTG